MLDKIPKDHRNRIIKKYVLRNYGLACIVLAFGVSAMWEYETTGSVTMKSPTLFGEDAKFLAWSLLTLGVVAILYCTISLIKTLSNHRIKEETIEKLYDSTYVICPKCTETFFGKEINNDLKCPNCDVLVEELEGFYEREQKNKNTLS